MHEAFNRIIGYHDIKGELDQLGDILRCPENETVATFMSKSHNTFHFHFGFLNMMKTGTVLKGQVINMMD